MKSMYLRLSGQRSLRNGMQLCRVRPFDSIECSPRILPRGAPPHRGEGSVFERAIKAIIVDSNTEWRHDSALEVAYGYYDNYRTLPGFEGWSQHLGRPSRCGQDICFGTLTHGSALGGNTE